MMLFACAAASACTAMRSSLTVRGNGVRDRSDDTSVGMPCVSSSPRTTSASLCDGVRKMTTRSCMKGEAGPLVNRRASDGDACRDGGLAVHLEEDHRHIVVLIG